MVFLYCFLRLNLKTRILAARSAPTMVPVTLPPETSSPPSLKDALTASSTSEPMSPASFSTRITSPGATRYCFPPVSMIACMQTSLLGAGTHGVRRNRWSKEPVYYIGAAGSNRRVRLVKLPYARIRSACSLLRGPAPRRGAPARGQQVLAPQHRCWGASTCWPRAGAPRRGAGPRRREHALRILAYGNFTSLTRRFEPAAPM